MVLARHTRIPECQLSGRLSSDERVRRVVGSELGVELERRGQLARMGASSRDEVTGGKLDDITVVLAYVEAA